MRDVDHGLRIQFDILPGHDKRTARLAVGVEYHSDLFGAAVHDLAELVHPGRTPDAPFVVTPFGDRLEEAHRELPTVVVGQIVVHLVGVQREGVVHAADRVVVRQVDRPGRVLIQLPLVPDAHQDVLEDRELVGVVPDVVEQLLDEGG